MFANIACRINILSRGSNFLPGEIGNNKRPDSSPVIQHCFRCTAVVLSKFMELDMRWCRKQIWKNYGNISFCRFFWTKWNWQRTGIKVQGNSKNFHWCKGIFLQVLFNEKHWVSDHSKLGAKKGGRILINFYPFWNQPSLFLSQLDCQIRLLNQQILLKKALIVF